MKNEPIGFELIDHSQIFRQILVEIDVETLRDERRKCSTLAICGPHPECASAQVSLGDGSICVREIQKGRASLEFLVVRRLGLRRRRGRVCSGAADIVFSLLSLELADIYGNLKVGGVQRDVCGGLDGAHADCDTEAS